MLVWARQGQVSRKASGSPRKPARVCVEILFFPEKGERERGEGKGQASQASKRRGGGGWARGVVIEGLRSGIGLTHNGG